MQESRITKLARRLRTTQTPEEHKLWYLLRSRRFYNYKFRRQFVIDKYIVDFCCYKHRLIIELDGGQHNELINLTKDLEREKFIKKLGYRILRVWNNEIDNNLEGVAEQILTLLKA